MSLSVFFLLFTTLYFCFFRKYNSLILKNKYEYIIIFTGPLQKTTNMKVKSISVSRAYRFVDFKAV